MGNLTKSLCKSLPLTMLLMSYGTAFATENGQTSYPAGAKSPYIANFPPIAGIFMLQQTSYATADTLYDDHGDPLPVPFRSSAFAQTTRLLFNYPFHPLGATMTSQLVLPYVDVSTNIAGRKSGGSGLAGITISPVILSWDFFDSLHLSTGVDLMPDSGDYDPFETSPAVGYSTYSPVVALRYEPSRTHGPVLATASQLLLNSTNHTTGYSSGDVYINEFQAGWNFDNVQVSAMGAYATQYQDDTLNGRTVGPNGNRLELLRYGPAITYTTEVFGPPIQFNVNYQKGMTAENTANSDYLWFNIAVPLYVPSMMPGA